MSARLEAWMRSYEPERLFDADGELRLGGSSVHRSHGRRVRAGANTRVPHRVRQALEDVAKDRGVNPLSFARTLLDEGLRRERHPGIVFRDGPAGRRAAIEGRRLDVWQVMETLWGSEGDIGDAAKYLGLRAEQVQAAVGYYSEFSDEVNSWIKRNREEAERLQERWKKEQAALRR